MDQSVVIAIDHSAQSENAVKCELFSRYSLFWQTGQTKRRISLEISFLIALRYTNIVITLLVRALFRL